MKILVKTAERSASLSVPRSLYSDDAVLIAARIFAGRAEVYHEPTRAEHRLTLVAARAGLDAAALEALGGEFLNELLNQEYRFVVGRFNRKIADVIAAQTLLSARGGEHPAPQPEDSPELKAEAERLMREAEEETKRTMPKRIPPQNQPIPPEPRAR
jgi:His-Xaa-Ser system protein HxsD